MICSAAAHLSAPLKALFNRQNAAVLATLVFLSLILAPFPSSARPKQVLYFPPAVSGPALSTAVLQLARERFEKVLGSYGMYGVVPDEDALDRIGAADAGEFGSCRDASCRTRLTRLAGADLSAWLSISGRRGACVVEGVLSPAWSERKDIKARFEGGCDVVEIVDAVGVVAAMMCGRDPRATAAPANPEAVVAPGPTPRLQPLESTNAPPTGVVAQPQPPRAFKAHELVGRIGFLTVETTPSNASIEIDGKLVGKSPFQAEVQVGRRRIRVMLDKFFHEKTLEVDVGPDGRRVDVQLAPAFGRLEVTSDVPGSLVTIDGRRVGTTPYVVERAISGTYVIEVSNPSRRPSQRKVVVSDGRTVIESFQLEQLVGVLSVLTRNHDDTPCSGHLSIDGKSVGTTPFKGTVPSGRHALEATCEGVSAKSVVDVPVDLRLSVVLRMPASIVPAAAARPSGMDPVVRSEPARPPVVQDAPAPVVNVKPDDGMVQSRAADVMNIEDERPKTVSKPLYKKWWFWTVIGIAAAGVAGGVAAGVMSAGGGSSTASGIMTH